MRKSILFLALFISFVSYQINAQTWSSLKRLTWNGGLSIGPSIATDSGNGIHMVWEDNTPRNYEIFYKRSSDLGSTWSGTTRLTWNVTASVFPSIATDSGSGIHVVWYDLKSGDWEIFYKRSTDSGATWSGLTRLTWNAGDSWEPVIATGSGNKVHVVWRDDIKGDEEIFYKRSSDGGGTWTGRIRLTWTSGWSYSPAIASDTGSAIHVVWNDYSPGNIEIFYKRSTDGGTTWSGPTRLTWTAEVSVSPSIATNSSNGIHVVWQDDTPGSYEIFYKRSSDGGTSWSGPKRLTWNAVGSDYPSVVTDSGSGIHVVWQDYHPGNYEIFHKQSTDGGATWSGLTRLTWNGGASEIPSIAADSGNGIHVAWQDDTPGVYEIFYKNRK